MTGEYRISLAVGTSLVPGSPFRVVCQQPRASESNSTVDLGGGFGFVGETYKATVTVLDQFGQMCVFTCETHLACSVHNDTPPCQTAFLTGVLVLRTCCKSVLKCV